MELIVENDSQSLTPLGDLVIKIAEYDQFDWFGHVKLIDCICNFVLLNPQIGQVLTVVCFDKYKFSLSSTFWWLMSVSSVYLSYTFFIYFCV